MLSIFVSVLVFAGIIAIVIGFSVYRLLYKVRLNSNLCIEQAPEDLLDWETGAFRPLNSKLSQLGFEQIGFRCDGADNVAGMRPKLLCVFLNADTGTFVDVMLSAAPAPHFVWQFMFTTIAESGHALITEDATNVNPLTPPVGIYTEVAQSVDFASMLAEHQSRFRELMGLVKTWKGDCGHYSEWVRKLTQARIEDGLRRRELAYDQKSNEAHFTLKAILRSLFQVPVTLRRQSKAIKLAKTEVNPFIVEPGSVAMVEANCQGYLKFHAVREHSQKASMAGLLWLLVSVVVFAFAFKVSFTWEVTLVVIGVLFIHEMGHILAMKAFGYRDLRMLFIPMLGAVAIGKNDQVKAWQEVVMLFMGPLPGIVLAIGLILYQSFGGADYAWLGQAILFLLIINLFNLIPVKPFDGGRIVGLTFFHRFPYLQAIFNIASGLGLFLLGFIFDARILWILGVVTVINAPAFWRRATMVKLFRDEYSAPLDEYERMSLLHDIFRFLGCAKFQKVPFAKRVEDAVEVTESIGKRHPGCLVTAGTLAIYLFPLWLPLLAIWPLHAMHEKQLQVAQQQWTEATVEYTQSSQHSDGAIAAFQALVDSYEQSQLPERAGSAVFQLNSAPEAGIDYTRDVIDSLVLGFQMDTLVAERMQAFITTQGRWTAVVDANFGDLYTTEIGAAFLVESLQHFRMGRVREGITSYRLVFAYADKLEASSIASIIADSYDLRSAAIIGLAAVSRQSDLNWVAINRYLRPCWESVLDVPAGDWGLTVYNQLHWSEYLEQLYSYDEDLYGENWYTKIVSGFTAIWEAYGMDDKYAAEEREQLIALMQVGPQLEIGAGSINSELAVDFEELDFWSAFGSAALTSSELIRIENSWRTAAIQATLCMQAVDLYLASEGGAGYPHEILETRTNPVSKISLAYEYEGNGTFGLHTDRIPYGDRMVEDAGHIHWIGQDALVPEPEDYSDEYY